MIPNYKKSTLKVLDEELIPLGFQSKSSIWNRQREDFIDVITLQVARHATLEKLCFTLNLGIFVPCFHKILFEDTKAMVSEADCSIRCRLGELILNDFSGRTLDKWWEITSDKEFYLVSDELLQLVHSKIHPFLKGFSDFQSIAKHLDQVGGFLSKQPMNQLSLAYAYYKTGRATEALSTLQKVNAVWGDKTELLRYEILSHA